MDTTFSHTLRAMLCPSCGAPIAAPTGGGTAPCRYCGVAVQIAPRNDRPLQLPTAAPVPEPERIARLRAQVNKPLMPPPVLMPLLHEGGLAPWKMQEAHAMWQSTRAQLAAGVPIDAAEALFFLTLLLFNADKDAERKRAMVETALDTLILARHRQVLRCMLARNAARVGDLDAARAWLEPCDSRSDDIESDTEYRFACAYLATVEGSWSAVYSAVGTGPHDVPIAMSKTAACSVLRANAYERQGAITTAVDLLVAEARTGGRGAVQRMETVIEANRELNLCPHSIAQSRSKLSPAQGGGRGGGGDGIHTVFIVLGGIFVLVGVPILLAGVVTLVLLLAGTLQTVSVQPIFLILGTVFTAVGSVFLTKGLRTRRILRHGIAGEGQILRFEQTGMRINHQPVFRLYLLVTLPGQAPYEATAKRIISMGGAGQISPGNVISVRVDPSDRMRVIVA
jgi:hypothetical protein